MEAVQPLYFGKQVDLFDNFLDRGVNAYRFIEQIKFALQKEEYNWFLN